MGTASVWEDESVLEMTVGVAAQQCDVPNATDVHCKTVKMVHVVDFRYILPQ